MKIIVLLNLALYIFDVVTDVILGVVYIIDGDTWWGGLTLALAAVTLVTTNLWSVCASIYLNEYDELKTPWKKLFLVFHLLQLGIFFRFLQKLWSPQGLWSPQNAEAVNVDAELFASRLIAAFMESAPQLVLQFYIMTQMSNVYWLTAVSAVFSLLSLVWVTEKVYKEEMDPENEICKHKWLAEMCLFMWPLFTITPRVLSLAMFASYYTWILFPVVGCHWIVMMIMFYCNRREWTIVLTIAFGSLASYVRIFIYFNMFEEKKSWKIPLYYSLIFVENTAMFSIWYAAGGIDTNYGVPLAAIVLGGFFLGIMFMSIYFYLLEVSNE